jgi:hypothetical protein
LPIDVHDTEEKVADGAAFCTPEANAAGVARPHTPPDDIMVIASTLFDAFEKYPTAAQLPADAHDTP